MPRDVEFNVTADDKTGTALASAERHFEESQKRIDKINKDHASKRQNDLDESAAKIGRRLESVFGDVSPKLAQSLAKGFASAGEAVAPVLGGVILGALPLIGATISGAIIGGAGLGGVVGGFLIAAKDARVQGAITSLSTQLQKRLTADASTFIEPAAKAVETIGKAINSIDFGKIFRDSSKYVAPLAAGVSKFIERIGAGVQAMISKAGPAIESISMGIAGIGDAIGDWFEDMADHGVAAGQALDTVFKTVEFTIRAVGKTVTTLTTAFGLLARVGAFGQEAQLNFIRMSMNAELAATNTEKVSDATRGLTSRVQGFSYAYSSSAEAMDLTNQYLEDSAAAMADAEKAARDLINANHTLFDTETSLGAAVDAATKARKENGRTLDAHTEKGRANREALSGVATAANAEYAAFVRVNGEGPKSAAVAENLRNKFIALATKLGASKTEANNLANSILNIPAKKDVKIKADPSDAIAASRDAKAAINSVNSRSVTLTVNVNASRLASVENRLNRLGGSMYNAANASWAASDMNSGMARTGGPSPVNVNNSIAVNLDGTPFYAMSVQAARQRSERDAWRQKVGRI